MADNMKEKYESLSLAVLRDVAKSRGIKGTSTMRKEAGRRREGKSCRVSESAGCRQRTHRG